MKVSYKICNFKLSTDIEILPLTIRRFEEKLNNYNPGQRMITCINYDNKRKLSICYNDKALIGIFIIEDRKLLTEIELSSQETKFFINRLSSLINDIISGKAPKSVDSSLSFAWLEALGFDLNKLRINSVLDYVNKVYNKRIMDIVAFNDKMHAIANTVPEVTIAEFYGTTSVSLELKIYLALCFTKEITPIAQDRDYFNFT